MEDLTEMATDKKVEDARCISKEDILEALDGLPEESRHCALLASNTLRAAVADYLKMAKEPWKKFYQPASHREDAAKRGHQGPVVRKRFTVKSRLRSVTVDLAVAGVNLRY